MRSENVRSPSFANTSTLERSTNTCSLTLAFFSELSSLAPGKVFAERDVA